MEDLLQSAKAKLEKLGGMFVPNSAPGELVTGAIEDINAALFLEQHSFGKRPTEVLPTLTLDVDESQRKSRSVKAPKAPVTFEIEL